MSAIAAPTSATSATSFPDTRPDRCCLSRLNFAMLKPNLAPYGSRVNLIHAGVWSHSTRLALCVASFGLGPVPPRISSEDLLANALSHKTADR